MVSGPFARSSYTQAIEILQKVKIYLFSVFKKVLFLKTKSTGVSILPQNMKDTFAIMCSISQSYCTTTPKTSKLSTCVKTLTEKQSPLSTFLPLRSERLLVDPKENSALKSSRAELMSSSFPNRTIGGTLTWENTEPSLMADLDLDLKDSLWWPPELRILETSQVSQEPLEMQNFDRD